MKQFFLAAMLVLCTSFAFSQAYLPKGGNQLNLGVGFSNRGVPVYIGFDHAASNDITLGLELSYRNYHEDYNDFRYNHNIFGFSANANYHLNRALKISKKYDLYGGLNLGFYSWSSPGGYKGTRSSGLGLGGQFGGRYAISSSVGLNLEFGGGNAFSGGKFGLTFTL